MNVLSLFDGMSCGQLALTRAAIAYGNYYASEVNPYAIKVCTANFPNTIHLGDVRNILKSDCPPIDLLIGGSPCQNFTFSGKRQGMCTSENEEIHTLDRFLELKAEGFAFEGQSYLFWEYVRLLKEINPRYFLLENVKMTKKWENIITTTLGTVPIKINSNKFSAQNRQRLYWTNIPLDLYQTTLSNSALCIGDILEDLQEEVAIKYQLTQKHLDAFHRSYKWKHCEHSQKSPPLLASYAKQPPASPYVKSQYTDSGFRRLTPTECERLQTVPDGYTKNVSDAQRYHMLGNGWTIDVIAHIFKGLA